MARGRSQTALLLVLTVLLGGCLETSNPAPPLCQLIVDLDEEQDLLWIYLMGVEHIRFDNMSLEMNGSRWTQSNVYVLTRNTTMTNFHLMAEASLGERFFNFEANLTLVFDNELEEYELEVMEPEANKAKTKGLPYSTLLEKVVMDQ